LTCEGEVVTLANLKNRFQGRETRKPEANPETRTLNNEFMVHGVT
jgi:hypothetical protein